jgi:hypothetical protein
MTISISGKKAALVNQNNIVENIIVWQDGGTILTDHTVVVLDAEHAVSIGWIYNNNDIFTDPNPPQKNVEPPLTLADLQAQLADLTEKIAKLSSM